MLNKAMQRKLERGECVDVSKMVRLGPYYVLPPARLLEDSDYCDAQLEAWVWSIGRAVRDVRFEYRGVIYMVPKGTVLVSLSSDLYQRDGFDCLFLR